MFYVNSHSLNETDLSLVSEVYGVSIKLNPSILSVELGVPRIRKGGALFSSPASHSGREVCYCGVFHRHEHCLDHSSGHNRLLTYYTVS